MFLRSLAVVLLTFLVFFNTYVWVMAATISRARLWLGLGFLFLIAVSFLVSSTYDRVRPFLTSYDASPEDHALLAGTPFRDMPDPRRTDKLSRGERVNVLFIVAVSQVVQVLTVAITTGAIFFVLGLILVSPQLLNSWTRGAGSNDGRILGMTLPVPEALIQTSMVLTAITFMYLSARAVTDTGYRSQFFDPLMGQVRSTLIARDRYRASLPARSSS